MRVGVLYLVASWLLLQLTDVLSSLLNVPESAGSIVVMFLMLGFIPVLVFSWVYEMTPEGLKREVDVDRSQSVTPDTGRKINTLHWGVGIGSNKYKDKGVVFTFSEFHKPRRDAIAHAYAWSGKPSTRRPWMTRTDPMTLAGSVSES